MTQRKASMNLDWHEGVNGLPSADLPDIPGYPCEGGRHWQVNFDNISSIDTYEFLGYGFYISLRGAHHGKTLEEYDFGFGPVATTDEVKQEVESLSPEEIAQAAEDAGLEPVDNVSASRKGKHMIRKATHRTAGMNLDWEPGDPGKDWEAPLPYIPGYPCADGFSDYVEVADLSGLEGTGWCFTMYLSLQNEDVNLYNEDFGIPYTDTAEEMMNIIENLSPEDIADALQSAGYMPEDAAVAARKADKRTASLDFDWRNLGSDVYDSDVNLNIPGYTYSPEYSWAEVYLSTYGWVFQFYIDGLKKDGSTTAVCNLYNRDFGIPDADSADEMMGAVENLDPQDIADALAAKGYMPDEE